MYQFLVEMVKVDGATTVRHLLSQGDESNVAEDRDIVGWPPVFHGSQTWACKVPSRKPNPWPQCLGQLRVQLLFQKILLLKAGKSENRGFIWNRCC